MNAEIATEKLLQLKEIMYKDVMQINEGMLIKNDSN